MPRGSHALFAVLSVVGGPCAPGFGAEGADPASALESAVAAAESHLQTGDTQAAEGSYRQALFEGFLLLARIEQAERRLPEARDALHDAALFRVESAPSLRELGAAQLTMGEAKAAVETLEALVAKDPDGAEGRRLLARALAADRQVPRAAQALAAAEARIGGDAELAFLMGTDYLWMKRPQDAERLFARVIHERPIPQTRVLIGRAYRDAGEHDRARAELQAALRQDPAARRAHYYLGMVILADARSGPDRLERAMAEFREELKRAPDDPAANDQLGLALLEAGRPAEALPALESAVRAQARPMHMLHLGRCLLALDRPAEAASALRRALEHAEEHGGSEAEIGKVHYQLGLALRKLDAGAEAASHLAEAGRRAAEGAESASGAPAAALSDDEASPLAGLTVFQRQGLERRARAGLARAYFNLGVLAAQGRRPAPAPERFARAAAFFERAAEMDPDFPQVQASLGVAYFNAREFAKATVPLARASALAPADRGLARMLATSWLNTEAWDKAAALLEDDPERDSDPALQFAYGLALLRSGRAAAAEEALLRVSAARGPSSELLVLLGQAHAAQGEDEEAIRAFEGALALDPSDATAQRDLAALLEARRK